MTLAAYLAIVFLEIEWALIVYALEGLTRIPRLDEMPPDHTLRGLW